MARVLLVDPFIITLVSAVRALGRRGDVCEVAWPYGAFKRAFKSRYVRRVHSVAHRAASPTDFAADVLHLCRSRQFDCVLPVSIESTEALIPIKEELDKYTATLLPTRQQLSLGADKQRTYDFCQQLGIAHPLTLTIRESSDLDAVKELGGYPIILKHTRNLGGSRGVRFVGNEAELLDAYASLLKLGDGATPILAQQYVPGLLFDAVTVARNGECPSVFTSVRKLMYPVSGGVTCISVSTQTPELDELARRVVQALDWNGPIEIEFKLDSRDGKFKLIEINPRFWASVDSAVRCGVNFPGIAVDLAIDDVTPLVPKYRGGERHKFLLDRIPYAYWQLLRVGGLAAIRDKQRYTHTTYDVDFGDPLPDLFTVLLLIRNLLVGRFPKTLSEGAKQMIEPLDTEVPYGR